MQNRSVQLLCLTTTVWDLNCAATRRRPECVRRWSRRRTPRRGMWGHARTDVLMKPMATVIGEVGKGPVPITGGAQCSLCRWSIRYPFTNNIVLGKNRIGIDMNLKPHPHFRWISATPRVPSCYPSRDASRNKMGLHRQKCFRFRRVICLPGSAGTSWTRFRRALLAEPGLRFFRDSMSHPQQDK